jgi:hypothetical protein
MNECNSKAKEVYITIIIITIIIMMLATDLGLLTRSCLNITI